MAAATAVKFDVTSNSRGSRKDLEREAVYSFRELERAEKAAGIAELGKRFGKAMADLHENLDHGEWMKTLERLGITYRKAQYWMHIVNGKRPTGSKKRPKARFDWDAATDWLSHLKSKVDILRKSRPQGADGFAESLIRMARELRGDDKIRREHANVLQRVRRGHSRVASAAHAGRPHSARGRR